MSVECTYDNFFQLPVVDRHFRHTVVDDCAVGCVLFNGHSCHTVSHVSLTPQLVSRLVSNQPTFAICGQVVVVTFGSDKYYFCFSSHQKYCDFANHSESYKIESMGIMRTQLPLILPSLEFITKSILSTAEHKSHTCAFCIYFESDSDWFRSDSLGL